MVARTRTAATPAAAILREDFANHWPPEPEPEPEPLTPTQDEFSDEYLCPYCATPTAPEDRKCPACSGDLWVKFRLREERSPWLWATLTLPIFGTLQSGVLLVLLLVYAYLAHDVQRGSAGGSVDFALRLSGAALQIKSEPFTLLPVYLGLPNQVPSHVASAALEALPRPVFFLFTLSFIFSLMMFIGLYQRWKPVFYLYLVSAALGLILAVAGMSLSRMDSLLFAGLSLISSVRFQRAGHAPPDRYPNAASLHRLQHCRIDRGDGHLVAGPAGPPTAKALRRGRSRPALDAIGLGCQQRPVAPAHVVSRAAPGRGCHLLGQPGGALDPVLHWPTNTGSHSIRPRLEFAGGRHKCLPPANCILAPITNLRS